MTIAEETKEQILGMLPPAGGEWSFVCTIPSGSDDPPRLGVRVRRNLAYRPLLPVSDDHVLGVHFEVVNVERPTEPPDPCIQGTVNWDGVFDWEGDGRFCGFEEFALFVELCEVAYAMAGTILREGNSDWSDPP